MREVQMHERTTRTYSMELSEDEAEVMCDVMGNISGSHANSRRQLTTQIYNGLRRVLPHYNEATDITGTLHMEDNKRRKE